MGSEFSFCSCSNFYIRGHYNNLFEERYVARFKKKSERDVLGILKNSNNVYKSFICFQIVIIKIRLFVSEWHNIFEINEKVLFILSKIYQHSKTRFKLSNEQTFLNN